MQSAESVSQVGLHVIYVSLFCVSMSRVSMPASNRTLYGYFAQIREPAGIEPLVLSLEIESPVNSTTDSHPFLNI